MTLACIVALLVGLTNPMALINGHTWALVNLIAITISAALCLMAVIRFCYDRPGADKINGKSAGITRFTIVWLITLNLCMYMATTSEAQVTGSHVQGTYQLNDSGTNSNTSILR
jgi:uncharacterized membrane protein